MKKLLKIVGWILGVVVLLVAMGVGYLFMMYPDVGPLREITATATPERIARGELPGEARLSVHRLPFGARLDDLLGPDRPGDGRRRGEKFDESLGFPGTIYAHNITPAALGSQSDAVLYRAITSGVDKNGKAMFPLMPYLNFNKMSEEDVLSIIAYVRTLKPIENNPPTTVLKAPMNLIVRTIPTKRTPQPEPDTSNTYEYGKYMITIAGCGECHTQQVKGEKIAGMEFAGGFQFPFPNGAVVRSANITPDEETGIGAWSESDFVGRFKFYDNAEGRTLKPEAVGYNSVMPWTMYAGMKENDLSAIYKYLRTVKPITNKVEKYTEAK